MSKPVICLDKDDSVHDAVQLMDRNNIGGLVVVEDRIPIGIITERDILRRVVAKKKDTDATKVVDVMTKDPVTIDSNTSLLEVTRVMAENNFRRLLVVNKKKLVGIVTAKDVISLMSA